MRRVTLILVVLGLGGSLEAQDEISLIRDAHKNSREAIDTIHAGWETTDSENKPKQGVALTTKTIVEWWQDRASIKCKIEISRFDQDSDPIPGKKVNSVSTTEYVVKDGQATALLEDLDPKGFPRRTASIRFHKASDALLHDLWTHSLFLLSGSPRVALDELLQRPSAVKSILKYDQKGNSLYRLRIAASKPLDGYEFDVVVDPKHNFLVKSNSPVSDSKKVTFRLESEVQSFKERAPGIFFPEHVETKRFLIDPKTSESSLWSVSQTHFTSVIINKPIDAAVFELAIPISTAVTDRRDNSSYVQGAEGKPMGAVGPAPTEIVQAQKPTYLEEPSKWWNYLLVLVCVLSVTTFVFILAVFFKRRRAARAKPE